MDRIQAVKYCRSRLDTNNLKDWKVSIAIQEKSTYVGLCDYRSKTIFLNGLAIDIQPEAEVLDTINHEVAHALCPNQGHNLVWATMAERLGARTTPCSSFGLPDHVLDAIRSGQHVEMTFDTIQIPKYKVTQLKEVCPDCGKKAVELFSIDSKDSEGNVIKLITLECFHIIKKVIPKATPFDCFVSNGWKPEVKSCKHNWNKNQCMICGEYKLYQFQVDGARSAEVGLAMQKGFGIFDDMGLGKTVQGLAIVRYHPNLFTPTLYVTKSKIKFQWFKQIIRWLGPEYLPQIIATSRDFVYAGLKSYVIPFDLLRRFPQEKLVKLGIKLVIIDECQQIKNPDSARTQALRKLITSLDCKVIGLSGTPWKNRGSELFAILNMMDPIKFNSYQHFLDMWVEYYEDKNGKKKQGGIKNPRKFREYVKDLIIRREYEEVMDEFPDVNRMKLPVQLDALNQTAYDESETEFVAWYNEAVIEGREDSLNSIELIGKMARMRHICGLAKIPATLGYLEEFIDDTDKKIVVFVHHKDVGQLMYEALLNTDGNTNPDFYELAVTIKEEGVKVFYFTADKSDEEIFRMQEEFNRYPRCIAVASTLALGEGVDMQTCADSILHERQWNPQNEDQATPGRFRRIGQLAKQININVLEGEGTFDEFLDEMVERKRRQFHQVMNKGEVPKWNEDDIVKEVVKKIVEKHRLKNKNKISVSAK